MTIASKLREHMRGSGRAAKRAVLTIAMDDHNVHCMTEDMLDEWFRSLDPEQKADIFDYILGAPELPSAHSILGRPFATGGIVELNAITVGLPAMPAPAECHGEPLDLRRPNQGPPLRALFRQSLDQLDQVDSRAPHAASITSREVVRHFNCRSTLGPVEVLR